MKKMLLALIRGYKKYISPRLGNNCRFEPSCSEYAMDAIAVHGSAKGGLLALWRILRCNPFGKVGYDPAPPKGRWKNDERKLYSERQLKNQHKHGGQDGRHTEE